MKDEDSKWSLRKKRGTSTVIGSIADKREGADALQLAEQLSPRRAAARATQRALVLSAGRQAEGGQLLFPGSTRYEIAALQCLQADAAQRCSGRRGVVVCGEIIYPSSGNAR